MTMWLILILFVSMERFMRWKKSGYWRGGNLAGEVLFVLFKEKRCEKVKSKNWLSVAQKESDCGIIIDGWDWIVENHGNYYMDKEYGNTAKTGRKENL